MVVAAQIQGILHAFANPVINVSYIAISIIGHLSSGLKSAPYYNY